jgi:hypothetical protein
MELVFKLPEGKLPVIAVRFDSVYQAMRTNQDLVDVYKDSEFEASIFSGSLLRLHLVCNNPHDFRKYENLKCDPHQLKVFMHRTRRERAFNFCHVMKEFNRDKLVKTLQGQNNFVIRLTDLKFQEFDK